MHKKTAKNTYKNKCYDLKVMIMDYYGGTGGTSCAINTP